MKFFLQKCCAYLRAALKTIVVPFSTVFTRISLLHLGQIVIAFRTLFHLGLLHSRASARCALGTRALKFQHICGSAGELVVHIFVSLV